MKPMFISEWTKSWRKKELKLVNEKEWMREGMVVDKVK